MRKTKIKVLFLILLMVVLYSGIVSVKADSTTLLNVDYPINNSKQEKSLLVQGWVMSEENHNLRILVDGKDIKEDIQRQKREDVLKAISGYGGAKNVTPGFSTNINISNYTYGIHQAAVEVVNEDNQVISREVRKFSITPPKTLFNIDYPVQNSMQASFLLVQGWAMSEADYHLRISIDGEEIKEEIERQKREDVLKVISGYGGAKNVTPGFSTNINISNYAYGTHQLKIEAIDENNQVIHHETRQFQIKAPATLMNIDYPIVDGVVKNNLYLQGWVMSDLKNVDVDFLLNGEKKEGFINRFSRNDVLHAISGYGGKDNVNPGFSANIDTSILPDGDYVLTVRVLADGKVIKQQNRNFKIKKYDAIINVDFPRVNEKALNSLTVQGWLMTDDQNAQISVSVDNDKREEKITRQERKDVYQVIQNYVPAINPTPGFQSTIDLTEYSYGRHKLTVTVVNRQGEMIREVTIPFVIYKPKAIINLDNPSVNQKVNRSFSLNGWMMSEDLNTTLKVLIDNNEVNPTITRSKRNDVLKAIHGYGSGKENPTPGFLGNLDLTSYADGNHELIIQAIDTRGNVITETKRKFSLKKYKSLLKIETPNRNKQVKLSTEISGYILTEAPNTRLEVYLDGVYSDLSISRLEDSKLDSSSYGGINTNSTPRFQTVLDTSNLSDGMHTVTVKLKNLNRDEIIETVSSSFRVKKYEGLITLDFPSSGTLNKKNDIFVRGWEMSEDPNSKVKVYYDNNEFVNTVVRTERPDVLSLVPGYGGSKTNSLPGFQTTIPAFLLAPGYHTLTIQVYNHMGELITTYTKQIYIYDGISLGIDVSEHNGDIKWDTVKYGGSVDFSFIRLGYRGYSLPGRMVTDSRFVYNATNANRVGIKTGVYFFSQAMNYEEGVAEANYVRDILALNPTIASQLSLPVALDVEYSTEPSHNGRADKISVGARTDAVLGFVNTLRNFGYRPVIYANKDFLYHKLDMNRLSGVDIWLAHWTYNFNSPSDYAGNYKYWQYHNSGQINGILGNVDLNVMYQ